MQLDGVRPFRVDVDYRQLLDTCTICKATGHLPRIMCPQQVPKGSNIPRSPTKPDLGKGKSEILTPICSATPPSSTREGTSYRASLIPLGPGAPTPPGFEQVCFHFPTNTRTRAIIANRIVGNFLEEPTTPTSHTKVLPTNVVKPTIDFAIHLSSYEDEEMHYQDVEEG